MFCISHKDVLRLNKSTKGWTSKRMNDEPGKTLPHVMKVNYCKDGAQNSCHSPGPRLQQFSTSAEVSGICWNAMGAVWILEE